MPKTKTEDKMNAASIIGSWQLHSFKITSPFGATKPWGQNSRGMLIYTPDATMSVSINKDIEGDPNDPLNKFNSTLFYSGTYEIRDDEIIHKVTNASDPNRIGKPMVRKASLEGRLLTLIGTGLFGTATLIWQKK